MDFNELAPRLNLEDTPSLEALVFGHRLRFLVPVRQPLVMVTQIQRCGGTLITQLLDGHSQLHVHPSELHIGKPKHHWPRVDLSRPAEEIFGALQETGASIHSRQGYLKQSPAEARRNPDYQRLSLPFIFAKQLQRKIFAELATTFPAQTQREILDHYITSYFNAWIDYAGLYRRADTVKYWVAFTAGLMIDGANYDCIRNDYPDGRFIIPVRDPINWYASAREHAAAFADVHTAIGRWLRCNENTLDVALRRPDAFHFVRFEDLVTDLKPALRLLMRFLGLPYEDCLLTPTFNGMPVASDSSFGAKYGIDREAADRSHLVSASDRAIIREKTSALYSRLLDRVAVKPIL
jgi:hypothetical protein